MNKRTLGIIIAVVALLVIGGAVIANQQRSSVSNGMDMSGESKPSQKDDTEQLDLTDQTNVEIDIKDFDFSKKNIKIKKGTTVTWTNRDSAKHNAFSDDDNGPKGELLAKDESYSFTFDTVGINNYYCTPHPYMKGIVNVVQ